MTREISNYLKLSFHETLGSCYEQTPTIHPKRITEKRKRRRRKKNCVVGPFASGPFAPDNNDHLPLVYVYACVSMANLYIHVCVGGWVGGCVHTLLYCIVLYCSVQQFSTKRHPFLLKFCCCFSKSTCLVLRCYRFLLSGKVLLFFWLAKNVIKI